MWLVGKIHDIPKSPGLIRGPEICSDEAELFFSGLQGKPVYFEHDERKEIGKVLEVWSSEAFGGQILASLLLHDASVYSGLAELLNNGLSIGQQAVFDKETGVRLGSSTPVEISVVRKGAVPGSRVIAFGYLNKACVSQSGILAMETQIAQVAKTVAESMAIDELEALRRDAEEYRRMKREREIALNADGLKYIEALKELGLLTPEMVADFEMAIKQGALPTLVSILRVTASQAKEFTELTAKFAKTEAELKEKLAKPAPEVVFEKKEDDDTSGFLKRLRQETLGTKRVKADVPEDVLLKDVLRRIEF